MNRDEKKSAAGTFLFGSTPIWRDEVFSDAFYDGILPYVGQSGRQLNVRGLLRPMDLITKAYERILKSDSEWFSEFKARDIHGLNQVLNSLESTAELAAKIPMGTRNPILFEDFLRDIDLRLRRLAEGRMVLIPGGWVGEPRPPASKDKEKEKETIAEGKEKEISSNGGVVLFALEKKSSDRNFRLGVVNTSKQCGLDYHKCTYQGVPSEPGSPGQDPPYIQHQFTLVFDDIVPERVLDSAFWFLLFRMHVFPSNSYTPRLLYEQLLPGLNSKPLAANRVGADPAVIWSASPLGGDQSMFQCAFEGFRYVLARTMTVAQSKYMVFLMWWELVRMLDEDLGKFYMHVGSAAGFPAQLGSFSLSDAELIRLACQRLAAAASMQAMDAEAMASVRMLQAVRSFIDAVEEKTQKILYPSARDAGSSSSSSSSRPANEDTSDLPPLLNLRKEVPFKAFPFADKLKRTEDVELLAGEARKPPVFRPVQFTLIPNQASSFHEVQLALRHCDHLCTLLAYQTATIANSYLHRVALIQHVFTRVIPLPMPHNHPLRLSQCFWSQPLRYADQVDILRLLMMVSRHYTASAMSLRLSRSFDASRVLTMACVATIADCIARISACDIPSRFSLHIDGKHGDPDFPALPFGFDISTSFAKQSEVMQFTDPNLVATRTKVLDYFNQQRKVIPDDHLIFNWETSTEFGNTRQLMVQVCADMGFLDDPNYLPLYLSEELTEVMDFYPEFAYYRDIIFTFKYMMAPTSDAFPPIKPYLAKAARLYWTYIPNTGGFVVRAFSRELVCQGAPPEKKEQKSFISGLIAFFFKQTRAPPSGADPTELAGHPIATEDDVLHIRELPTFEHRISQRDSELLMSYLTAPYLRIPLVLNFFAQPERLLALGSPELRNVLHCVLFEPGLWQAELEKVEPTVVPAPNRAHLATPCGLLFNEIMFSSIGILQPLQALLDLCLDLDTGKFVDHTAPIILFIIRTVVRVESYMLFLLSHHRWAAVPAADRRNGSNAESYIRGLGLEAGEAGELKRACAKLRQVLLRHVCPMLTRWCQIATKQQNNMQICIIWAHLALILQNTLTSELKPKGIASHLCANLILNIRYTFTSALAEIPKKETSNKDAKDEPSLDIPETEIFDLFQNERNRVMEWLLTREEDANAVMEAVVRVLTQTGTLEKRYDGVVMPVRKWQSLPGRNCEGRFVPELADNEEVKNKARSMDNEINIQLGDFTLDARRVEVIQHLVPVHEHGDYIMLFGTQEMQAAEVKLTSHRSWYRLLGRRHDLLYWTPDTRRPSHGFIRPCLANLTESWILDAIAPHVAAVIPNVQLFLSKAYYSDADVYAHLAGDFIRGYNLCQETRTRVIAFSLPTRSV